MNKTHTVARTLRLDPGVNKALEAVLKMTEVEHAQVAFDCGFHFRSPDGDDWDWVAEFKPNKHSINSLIIRSVMDDLEDWHQGIQKMQPRSARAKEGYEQILKFLFDHPEIEYARAEHFTQDDPAYELLQAKIRKQGETEWTVHDDPLDRTEAANRLADMGVLLKVEAEALAALDQVLVPYHKTTPNSPVEARNSEQRRG